jgi:hypothetical protein
LGRRHNLAVPLSERRAAFRRLPPQSIRTCQVTSSPAWLPIRLPRSQGGHGCNGRNASRLPAGPGAASSLPRSIGSSASRIQNQSWFKRDRSLLKSGNGSIARPCRDPIWLRLTAAKDRTFKTVRPNQGTLPGPGLSGSRTMTGPGCPIADRLPEHSGPAHSVDELP